MSIHDHNNKRSWTDHTADPSDYSAAPKQPATLAERIAAHAVHSKAVDKLIQPYATACAVLRIVSSVIDAFIFPMALGTLLASDIWGDVYLPLAVPVMVVVTEGLRATYKIVQDRAVKVGQDYLRSKGVNV